MNTFSVIYLNENTEFKRINHINKTADVVFQRAVHWAFRIENVVTKAKVFNGFCGSLHGRVAVQGVKTCTSMKGEAE